jgi:hypothetical protein
VSTLDWILDSTPGGFTTFREGLEPPLGLDFSYEFVAPIYIFYLFFIITMRGSSIGLVLCVLPMITSSNPLRVTYPIRIPLGSHTQGKVLCLLRVPLGLVEVRVSTERWFGHSRLKKKRKKKKGDKSCNSLFNILD